MPEMTIKRFGVLSYNGAAGIVGGIKFELESVGPAYAAPPAPNQWAPQ